MKYTRGITFIETLVWISVFTFAMLAITISLLSFYRANTYTIEQAHAVTSAQRGIERMVKTMREAAYSSEGAYPIVSIAANDVVFYADIDSDPLIERIHYYIQGETLMQGIRDPSGDPPTYTGTEATSTVSDFIRNTVQGVTTFRYYDENGAEITNYTQVSSVRYMTMTIVVNVNPNRLPNELTLTSSAAFRNIE